jgi:hypothetical protein
MTYRDSLNNTNDINHISGNTGVPHHRTSDFTFKRPRPFMSISTTIVIIVISIVTASTFDIVTVVVIAGSSVIITIVIIVISIVTASTFDIVTVVIAGSSVIITIVIEIVEVDIIIIIFI